MMKPEPRLFCLNGRRCCGPKKRSKGSQNSCPGSCPPPPWPPPWPPGPCCPPCPPPGPPGAPGPAEGPPGPAEPVWLFLRGRGGRDVDPRWTEVFRELREVRQGAIA